MSGTLGSSSIVVYNWDPATQLSGFLSAEAQVAAGVSGASDVIVAFGDSTTEGVGAPAGESYPAYLTSALAQDSGLPVQDADFQGEDRDAGSVTLIDGASNSGGIAGAGGVVISTNSIGQGFDFSLTTSGTFNTLDYNYVDDGSGTVSVTIFGGPDGSITQTLTLGNSGQIKTQTISLPLGVYSSVQVEADSSADTYTEGVAFSNTTKPAIQVFNAGVGGAWSSAVGNGQDSGTGEFPGGLELHPKLVLIDYGINDILDDLYTTAETVSYISAMIVECRAAGADPIIVIPEPFGLNPYLDYTVASPLPTLISALETLAVEDNVPLIDLSATYGDDAAALSAVDLLDDGPHPGGPLYSDIADRIAALLTGTDQTYFPVTGTFVVDQTQTITGTSGDDILFGDSTINIMTGNGGIDTYVMHSTDVSDTINNGLATSTAPSGQLDVDDATHEQLWFERSGNNLVVDVLGSSQQTVIENWYSNPGQQLAAIVTDDGDTTNGNLQNLIEQMASFSAANPSFNPQTTSDTSLTDGYYDGAVADAVADAYQPARACFAAGTRILTARGALVAVEALAVGDEVETIGGQAARICWIGRRTLEPRRHPAPETVLPVRIAAGAFGAGLPWRDLFVSPDHAFQVGGYLVPAKALMNGHTIRQVERARVSYYHLELPRHDVLFAEGLAAESYFDTGNRGAFENGGGSLALHPDFARGLRARAGYAPLLESGPVVEAERRRLLELAGIATTGDPQLRVIYRHGEAIIASRSAVPGDILTDPRDRRRLGVKISALRIAGRDVALDHPDLVDGWHAIEADGRWTNGWARVPAAMLGGRWEVEVKLASTLAYPFAAAPAARPQFSERCAG